MELFGIATFERFFREAAGLDVDKGDLRRFDDFVDDRIHGLLLRGVVTARANARDVVEPQDLPIPRDSRSASTTSRRSTRRCPSTPSSNS
jgi:hypothetical protein